MRMASALGRTGDRLALAGRREDGCVRGELAPEGDGERPEDPAPFLPADEIVVVESQRDRWRGGSDPEHEGDDEFLDQHETSDVISSSRGGRRARVPRGPSRYPRPRTAFR